MTITLSSEVQKMLRLLRWKLNSKTLLMVHHMNAETTCTNTRNSYSIETFLHDIWTRVNHDVTDVTFSCMVYILIGHISGTTADPVCTSCRQGLQFLRPCCQGPEHYHYHTDTRKKSILIQCGPTKPHAQDHDFMILRSYVILLNHINPMCSY